MSIPLHSPVPRRERRARLRKSRRVADLILTGALLTGSFATTSLYFGAAPAVAISNGTGIISAQGSFIGNYFHSDGSIVYCGELGRNAVMGSNPALAVVTELPAYSTQMIMVEGQTFNNISAPALDGDGLRHYNYVLSHWGSTADSFQAASVQIALWTLRAPGASASYHAHLDQMRGLVGADVVANANAMIAEAQSAGGAMTAPEDPRLIGINGYSGLVVVDPGTTSLTITNGIFTSTGTNTITFPGGTTTVLNVPFQGVPTADLESWDRYYTVTINGTYEYDIPGGEVRFGTPGGPLDQGLVTASPAQKGSGNYEAVLIDPDTIWSPTLSTQVPSQFVPEGEHFSDVIMFDVAENSNEWRWANNSAGTKVFAPIKANGTLYGPFLSDPALNPAATPPVGAPVAATTTITTSSATGPGAYEVESTEVSLEAGYYSWVWNIDFDEQLASVQSPSDSMQPSIPENYFFTDGFGQALEGQITPSHVRFTTQLSSNQVVIGDSFTDDVTVYLNKGGWLQTDGGRTPFTLRGTVYALDEAPVQQASAPADAEVLATTTMVVNGPDQTFTSDAIGVPLLIDASYVTVQWCLFDEDQPESSRGKAAEWCDDFGVPAETAEIVRPTVTTQATETGAVKGDIHDTAIITGGFPADVDASVGFTAYLKPEVGQPKYDENWEVVLDSNGDPVLWAADEVNDPAAVCQAQPVAKTERVPVTGVGIVESPAVRAETEGTIYWIEDLYITPPGGDEVLYHSGECGLPNETTIVEYPNVTTKAVTEAHPGDEIFDTAIVDGPLSERAGISYEVTFEAYHRAEGTTTAPDAALCTVDTLAWESTVGTPVSTSGEYESERWKITEQQIGEILWIETLWMIEASDQGETRTELHRGNCGEENEITTVTKRPELPVTGAVASFAGMGILAVGMLIAGAVLMIVRRRQAERTNGVVVDSGNGGLTL